MRAELICLRGVGTRRHLCFPVVVRARTSSPLTDTRAPVVAVRETTARPAQVRRGDALHIVDEGSSNSIDVRNLRLLADPNAVVDDSAEMLDEVSVDVRADDSSGSVGAQFNLGFCRRRRA